MLALRRMVQWLARHVIPRLPFPVIRGPLKGIWFVHGSAAGNGGGISIHLGRSEVSQTEWVRSHLRRGQVFIDVGANIGYYTLLASRIVGSDGRVVAIEPLPRNITFLERHIRLNDAGNVMVVPLACSDTSGQATFHEGANAALGRLASRSPIEAVNGRAREIVTSTLDDIVRRYGLQPDMIKIDVEGAELAVLEGARDTIAAAAPILVLSVHSGDLRRDCVDLLEKLGYQVRPLDHEQRDCAFEFAAESHSHTDSKVRP
jgi:FkbM family methyltransferase